MMILRSASASPFARTVRIAAAVLDLAKHIEVTPADTSDPNDALRVQNPLGKIPTLVLADGRSIFDSRVILEYLDHLAGGGRIIPAGPDRFDVLTLAALADGIADAAILKVYETRWREDGARSARWLDHQTGKIGRGLAAIDALRPEPNVVNVASLSIACALGYLDLRFAGAWRSERPQLVGWLDAFAAHVPSFEATRHRDP